MSEWVSVKDRLPKLEQRVLVYYPNWSADNNEYQIAYLTQTWGAGIQFVTYDDVMLIGVTHWRPIPRKTNG